MRTLQVRPSSPKLYPTLPYLHLGRPDLVPSSWQGNHTASLEQFKLRMKSPRPTAGDKKASRLIECPPFLSPLPASLQLPGVEGPENRSLEGPLQLVFQTCLRSFRVKRPSSSFPTQHVVSRRLEREPGIRISRSNPR